MSGYDVARFVEAQGQGCGLPHSDYRSALAEIRAGHKDSHWIWYIFPQLEGLGQSDFCHTYGVRGLGEAQAYLANDVLRARLGEISRALLELETSDPVTVLGRTDARKVRSCMTLFALADGEEPVFGEVLRKFYGGCPDERTLELLGVEWNDQ